jgi:D-alanyl-D-alanine carboxypeptidase (penicillin-binding protein 5/6)
VTRDGTTDGLSEFSSLLERPGGDDAHRREDDDFRSAARRRAWRAVIAVLLVLALVALAIGGYVWVLLTATPPDATAETTPVAVAAPAPFALTLPAEGAAAVAFTGAETLTGFDGTGAILGASGGDEARPIASITKLVTALVILEEHPLAPGESGPTLAFDEADSDLYDEYYVRGATVQPMKEGSSLSEHDVLELMLVASATNYSDVASTWAFGSPGAFRSQTARWLASHGLTGTRILEPTGLDPGNVSTPADLLALGRLALGNPVIAEIVGSPYVQVPGIGSVTNTNTLLGTPGVTGIKTGTLDEAGSCLLFSVTLPVGASAPLSVVGVVLGAPDRYSADQAAQGMLDSISAGFHEVPLVTRGDRVGTYSTPWGESAAIVAGADAGVLTWSDAAVAVELTAPGPLPISAADEGGQVGSATFTASLSEGAPVTVPLILDGGFEGPDAWWRLLHPREMLGTD